jgi:hypothetical protein
MAMIGKGGRAHKPYKNSLRAAVLGKETDTNLGIEVININYNLMMNFTIILSYLEFMFIILTFFVDLFVVYSVS